LSDPLNDPAVEVAPGVLAETMRRFLANRLSVAGLAIVILLAIAAILADVLSPYPRDFAVFSQTLKPPSPQHLLGTDAVGRDFLTRLLHGARTSMLVGLSVPILAAVIGVPLGAFAAWRGGRVDALFLRVVEIFTAIPPYMLVILLVSIWGSGVDRIILFLGATGWVGLARLARAQVVGIRPQEFVTSAHALGASDWRILSQHILPNAAGAMVVVLVMSVPSAIFAEAGLSVLGLGVKDPIPSWGKMITEGIPYASSIPLLALIPIGLIALTMLAFSFVGDGLRDAFDPHSRQ
jgi:ABC-type dipeptide/oligopeptide/nickel transport system permease subunit